MTTSDTTCSASLALDPDEIHVWIASLELSAQQTASLLKTLSPDEKVRAERYISREAKDRFIAARGVLRNLLARYLARNAAGIQFDYNENGRPVLASSSDNKKIAFNISHSGAKALFAFSAGIPIGIDIEMLRSNLDFVGIAERFFAPGEAADLASLPEADRKEAFFACWTRKEAFVKARGTGILLNLNQIEVSLRPREKPTVIRADGDNADLAAWSLRDLEAGAGFKAAVAVRAANPRLVQFDYVF